MLRLAGVLGHAAFEEFEAAVSAELLAPFPNFTQILVDFVVNDEKICNLVHLELQLRHLETHCFQRIYRFFNTLTIHLNVLIATDNFLDSLSRDSAFAF